NVGRFDVPALAPDCLLVEDRPDRAATIHLFGVAGPGERGCEIFIVALLGCLVVEAQPVLLHQDQVLIIAHRNPDGLGAEEVWTGRVDHGRRAVRPRAHAALVEHVVVLRGLAGGGAERSADLHGRDLAVSVTLGPAAVLGVIFLGQPYVEHG